MILVTGGSGFLGSNLRAHYAPDANVCFLNSNMCDLRDLAATYNFFEKNKPTKLIHLAGLVGGIRANSERQYDFFYDNLMINTNVVHAALKFQLQHVVALSSVCVYPRVMPEDAYPLSLADLYKGEPEYTNAGYAHAKRAMQAQITAARQNYGLKASVIYPANLYGPFDHFGEYGAHVIPDLVWKMHQAKVSGLSSVELYGTGQAMRQFTFAEDLCKAIKYVSDNELTTDANFYSTDNIKIETLAHTIKTVVGFEGELIFNGKLDGQFRRDVTRDMEIENIHELSNGIKKSYEWFLKNKQS